MNELFSRDHDIRIQELTVEAPPPETVRPFDPEREITDEYWELITRSLLNLETYRPQRIQEYAVSLANAIVLSPERVSDFRKRFQDRALEVVMALIEEVRNGTVFGSDYATRLRSFRIIAPAQLKHKYDILFQEQADELKHLACFGPSTLASVQIAFPGRIDDVIPNEFLKNMVFYARYRDLFASDPCFLNLSSYAEDLANMRIVRPNGLAEFQPVDSFWSVAESMLANTRGDWDKYLQLAAHLKTIAAEKIIIDENGVQLVLPPRRTGMQTDETPLPTLRHY